MDSACVHVYRGEMIVAAMERIEVDFDEKRIDEIFSEVNQCHLPGVAVGIAVDGTPVYRKGFGRANMELPLENSPTLRYRIGSTSKHFTCFAYLLLCEEGKAHVDDPVAEHFPDLHKVTRSVTMRQLMGNISGIRDVYELFTQFSEPYSGPGGAALSVTGADLVKLYLDISDVNAPPGLTWIYNNGGWLLLSLAIERISKASLEDVMWHRIFKPVGMYDSLLLRGDTSYIPNRASQHVVNKRGGFERMFWGLDNFLGAGAIVSTVDDMLRWLAHMDSPTVGTVATWDLMRTPLNLSNGTSTGYGLGLYSDHHRGVQTIHHAGNAFGGNAQMMKVPAAALDVVVISNRQDVWGWQLADRILDECLPSLAPVTGPKRVDFPAGVYRSRKSGRVVQVIHRNEQHFASIGGWEFKLESKESGTLWACDLPKDGKFGIQHTADARAKGSILVNEFGNVDELEPVKSGSPREGPRIVGRYGARSLGIEVEISCTDGVFVLRARGWFSGTSYELEHLADRVWRAKSPAETRVGFLGGFLVFDSDTAGFEYWNAQTRALGFTRIQ